VSLIILCTRSFVHSSVHPLAARWLSPVVKGMRDGLHSEVGASTFLVYFDLRMGVKDCYFVTRRNFTIPFRVLSSSESTMGREDDLPMVFRSQLPPNWMGQTTARERSNLTGSSSEPRAFRFGLQKWILSEIANRRSSGRILFPVAPTPGGLAVNAKSYNP
jgi:hypothetical protein